jgi:acyl-CoA synthetase (AMP-forming)/AMP-acid ligase II
MNFRLSAHTNIAEDLKDYVVLMLALLKIAVPFALISCFSTPFELKHALKVTKTTRLFTTSQYIYKALPVVLDAGIPTSKIYTMNGSVDGYESLEQLVAKAGRIGESHNKPRIVPKDSLAFLFFSSGTTGLPKGKQFDHCIPWLWLIVINLMTQR